MNKLNRDLLIVGLIFTIIVFIINQLQFNVKYKNMYSNTLYAMKVAIELNKENDEYISMVSSLNDELDKQQELINFYESNYEILKDLR